MGRHSQACAEVALLIAARRDQVKLAFRRALLLAVMIGLAIVAVAILVASACVMLVVGIAGGVGELVGGRIWLGQLLTGLGFVIGGGSFGFGLVRIAQRRWRARHWSGMEKSNDNQSAAGRMRESSEADFLAGQAAAAQQALSHTLERMRADLGDSADLAEWARRYPWPTMGAAAAVGFLAVVAIGGTASSRSAESSAAPEESDSPSQHPRGRRRAEPDRGMFRDLMSEILRNFATAAQGALLAAIGARFQAPPAPPDDSPSVPDPMAGSASGGNGFAPPES